MSTVETAEQVGGEGQGMEKEGKIRVHQVDKNGSSLRKWAWGCGEAKKDVTITTKHTVSSYIHQGGTIFNLIILILWNVKKC